MGLTDPGIVAIQQPEHLPWIGFFDKMTRCDTFVLLDNVQFKKRYFENRNKIRTPDGFAWVGVPVRTKGRFLQRINEVEIDPSTQWTRKYWPAVRHAYARAPYFSEYAGPLEAILSRDWGKLVDLNVALIEAVREILEIRTPLDFASELVTRDETGSDLVLSVCKRLHASRYISGPDGVRYLDLERIEGSGIDVAFHQYAHPEYTQLHKPFISHLSVIDLIFNHGKDSLRILGGS